MIRKVTVALSLAVALTAAVPGEAFAARTRDRENTQLSQEERGLLGHVQRLLRRFRLTPLEAPVVPHPQPTTTERKITNA
ncbi:MAG TPA: hypothetical protein VGF69_16320 [Thermoanaerobaculia bacterium]